MIELEKSADELVREIRRSNGLHTKWLELVRLFVGCRKAGSSEGDRAEISVLCLGGGTSGASSAKDIGWQDQRGYRAFFAKSVAQLLFYLYSLSNHLHNVPQPLLPLSLRIT